MTDTACRLCGVATDQRPQRRQTRLNMGTPTPSKDFDTGLCGECVSLRPDEPGVILRVVASLLKCHPGDPFFETALRESDTLDGLLLWDDPRVIDGGRARQPQRKPWGHVTREQRQAWKAMRVKAVADRMQADAESLVAPQPEPPPEGFPRACLACGVGLSLQWFGEVSAAYSLTRTATPVTGWLCDACGPILQQVGALGQPFIERAVMQAKGLPWSDAIRIPNLRAWVAEDLPPQDVGWEWLDLTPPPLSLDPVTALMEQVATLQGEVAALRVEVESLRGVTV